MSFGSEPKFVADKPQDIPNLHIHQTAPTLDESAAAMLQEQWQRFWTLRAQKRREASVQSAHLDNGYLLHHVRYDENLLAGIFRTGILSGELGFSGKEPTPEDAETHYCADFFINYGAKSISEYIDYSHGTEEGLGIIRKKRIEAYACPDDSNDSIAIVIDSSAPELRQLLNYSASGVTAERLKAFSIRFPYADKPEITKRHLAVLVGIPSNFITSVIIGGKLANDPQRLLRVKEMIQNTGRNVSVFDYKGQLLN